MLVTCPPPLIPSTRFPPFMVILSAKPLEETYIHPKLLIAVLLAVPPDETYICPAAVTEVLFAVPPETYI